MTDALEGNEEPLPNSLGDRIAPVWRPDRYGFHLSWEQQVEMHEAVKALVPTGWVVNGPIEQLSLSRERYDRIGFGFFPPDGARHGLTIRWTKHYTAKEVAELVRPGIAKWAEMHPR